MFHCKILIKKIAKELNVPRDTVGNIVQKFKIKATWALKKEGTVNSFHQISEEGGKKNPPLTKKDLQQELVVETTEV